MTALLTNGVKESFTTAEDTTTVLVVDDSAAARRFVGRLVERRPGFRAVYACNGREALAVLGREACAAVVTDLHMPGMDGLELVEAIRDRYPLAPVVLMTAEGSEDTAVKALQGGAASYVSKQRPGARTAGHARPRAGGRPDRPPPSGAARMRQRSGMSVCTGKRPRTCPAADGPPPRIRGAHGALRLERPHPPGRRPGRGVAERAVPRQSGTRFVPEAGWRRLRALGRGVAAARRPTPAGGCTSTSAWTRPPRFSWSATRGRASTCPAFPTRPIPKTCSSRAAAAFCSSARSWTRPGTTRPATRSRSSGGVRDVLPFVV